ncbi:biotin transporter BioY [Salinibacterium soli]|uniref:Biotin transporter n=1 Tax=Antiquaquibacter soli TaxID=3064523 RepID=A0ABT9BLQ6_9MICO|nr:biotin transporter BioY [Protaetiibacter sp. WY-16]MDO7881946.1 biotin transporter BioY [Protaetiibacter sp. WY-16]
MSSLTLAVGRPTLADKVFSRSIATDLVLIAAGAALTAVAAQIAVPLWPVPITGQTLAVLLVGVFLGATRGAASLALYAVLGIVGLPVFSDASSGWHVVAGPTGGYIIGFVFAAAFTGWLAQREWDRKPVWAFLAFLVGSVIPFAFGLPWLAAALGNLGLDNSLGAVLQSGLYPFILGGVIKAALGAGIISLAWFGVRRRDARAESSAE